MSWRITPIAALMLGVAALATLASAGVSRADATDALEPGTCRVREIRATRAADHIDDRLTELAPLLARPPLSAWNHFDLLDEVVVARGTWSHADLTERTQLTFAEDGRVMVRNDLGAVIVAARIDPGARGVHFVGGQPLEDGAQVLAIDCR